VPFGCDEIIARTGKFCGGGATYCIMPHEVMELGCLLNYDGDAYYEASLGRAGS